MAPAVPFVFSSRSDQQVLRPCHPAPVPTKRSGRLGRRLDLRGATCARDVIR